ncbi:flagellar hook-length control protein FliK [Pelomonas sp. BJYL3]|uniref:flagellar hook-length control protein FliK n=1 Tax=Pelomonas sp. BJYL3 TaxID=2976697 RepID=UPI0022B53FBA|nr:flagellar hook-length control protein FliK [Pelomonas sp. BJYL3]
MNKMMLTPTAGTSRSAAADLLSQLGSARGGQDGEASAAFAQLLQAKGGVLSAAPVASSPRQPAAAGNTPAAPLPGSEPVAAPSPRASAPAPSHTPASPRPEAESSRNPAADLARRQDAARADSRRMAQGKDRQSQAAQATAEADAQDPVLAQVLRHLRKDDGPSDAEIDATAEDAPTETQDAAEDASLTAAVPQAQLPGQEAQKALPAAGDATLASTDALGSQARSRPEGLGEAGPQGLADGTRGTSTRDARNIELPAGLPGAAAQAQAQQALAGAGASPAQAAGADEAALALEATAPGGKAGAGPAHEPAALPAGFAGLLQQAQAGGVHERGTGAAPAGARYELQSPLHAPGFAPEMAARLSLAATEGVQQAQLHLNPSEMGPVQVQIVLDGQQAQISFVAEQADTRAVLEKSLPELAGALREQGLTLSGGGVFSQQQQAQSGQSGQADREGSAAGGRWAASSLDSMAADDMSSAQQRSATAPRRSRGVLDLFA